MDHSKSSKEDKNSIEATRPSLPKRSFSVEFFVGLFTVLTLLCAAYLAVGLGGLEINSGSKYLLNAEFDNVSGLEYGASVEIAGVKVGEVVDINLDDLMVSAIVSMKLNNSIKIMDDDIAAIRTKGIIGDRYVKISRGASDVAVEPNGTITETESVVDIEDVIGKIVHSLEGGKDS